MVIIIITMNKKSVFMVLTSVFLLLVTLGAQFLTPSAADPAIIRVPAVYPTIQEAINAAKEGDIVQVAAGTYYENVVVNKSLTLIGENRSTTVIDGNWTGPVLNVTADNVEIAGFTIQNGGMYGGGIYISSSGNIIRNNIVSNNTLGIYLHSSSGNTISDNTISPYWAGGIFLENSDGNTIKDNKVYANALYPELGTGGIVLTNSQFNVISGNTIWNNGYHGIFLDWDSSRNTISDNTILNNERGLSIGSDRNKVVGNTISKNGDGVAIEYGSATVVGNTISDNYRGIYLYRAGSNTFYHNNIINNKEQLRERYEKPPSGNIWDNGAEGNYWSDYNGTDVNGDGIGDTNTPHQGVDNYPLMTPWSVYRIFDVSWEEEVYQVTTFSNSTIASFNFSHLYKQISFNVTGPPGAPGFCNVTIPKTLLRANETHPWQVLLDDGPISYIKVENATHTSLYFHYTHSTRHVQIIGSWVTPEFPAALILPLLIITALLAIILRKMTQSTKKPHNYANSKRSD